MSNKDFEESFELLSPLVKKHTKIVTPDTLGQNVLYHIAKTKMKTLVPNVSKRAADSEDNTVPRVHVATTLLGCFIGYASTFFDLYDNFVTNKVSVYTWLGGYYLYTIPFEFALKPSSRLVFDSDVSKEHWLIPYSKETATYTPSTVTKLIAIGLNSYSNNGDNVREGRFALAVPPTGVHLYKNNFVKEGYYTFTLVQVEEMHDGDFSSEWDISDLKEISQSEFFSIKKTKATMLSMPTLVSNKKYPLEW